MKPVTIKKDLTVENMVAKNVNMNFKVMDEP